MKSPPTDHLPAIEPVDDRIVGALERICQVFRTLLWEKAKQNSIGLTLSPIQIQILTVLHRRTSSRIGELSREFDLTAATVSEAVRVLHDKRLLTKQRSEEDGRIQVLHLTPHGEKTAEEVADWAGIVANHLGGRSDTEKVIVMRFLLDLIEGMHRAGLITVTRMCVTCRYFGPNESADPAAPHFCHLMDLPLQEAGLRLDCPEHEPAG